MSRYKKRGWFNESHRHYLAAKGVKTSKYMAHKLPPGFKYAVDRDKGVLTNVFEGAFDASNKTKKLGSFEKASDNKVVRSFDSVTDAPEKAFRAGALFELKSPFSKEVRKEKESDERFTEGELFLNNPVDIMNEGELVFDETSDPRGVR